MRIGMMLDMYKPHISGVTNYVSLNRAALEQAGHEVAVFTFGAGPGIPDEPGVFRSAGVPVADSGFYLGFRHSRVVRHRLQEMDVVHVHHPFLSGALALRYCRPRGIPIVFTNHTRYDLYAQVYLPMIPEPLSQGFLQAYMPAFCREVDLVIAPSTGVEKVLRSHGVESPIEVIPNGVDLAPFQQVENPAPRGSLGLTEGDVGLAYVGRLGVEKNLSFLLRSMAAVRSFEPRARLVLVGGGPEASNLRGLARDLGIEEAVHFTGPVAYEQVPRVLASCDAFVTASVSEVHPLSVIEAMASGLPVVAIEGPGLSDTIQDGEDGFLCPYDSETFAARLGEIVRDSALRRRMGTAARQTARRYDIQRTSAEVEGHYRTLTARSPRRPSRAWDRTWRTMLDRLL